MRDELADAFLHSTGADIREGHGEAFYVPSRDFISMPALAVAPARLCTGWFAYWSIRYELRSISPRDEYGCADP